MVQRKVQYLTEEGYAKLHEELEELRTVRRREIAERLKSAAEVGGTVDNAEYDEAKREQARIEGRVQDLEELLQSVEIISKSKTKSDRVQVGSKVKVKDAKGKTTTYFIVGSAEAEPTKGNISNTSPVGMALMGQKAGEEVAVETPTGPVNLKVVAIE